MSNEYDIARRMCDEMRLRPWIARAWSRLLCALVGHRTVCVSPCELGCVYCGRRVSW